MGRLGEVIKTTPAFEYVRVELLLLREDFLERGVLLAVFTHLMCKMVENTTRITQEIERQKHLIAITAEFILQCLYSLIA